MARAISSVYQQTLGLDKIELIVVDDHSSQLFQNYLKLFEAETELKKQFFYNQDNKGPGYCRNFAIEKAKGKYLLFLDSDDFLPSYAMQDMVDVAERTGCDIVSGKRLHLDGSVPNARVFQKTLIDCSIYDTFAFDNLSANGKIFRRDFIRNNAIAYAETRKYGEDQPFLAKSYLLSHAISILADKPYLHMERFDDLSLVKTETSLSNRLDSALEVSDIIDTYADKNKDILKFKLRAMEEVVLSIHDLMHRPNVIMEVKHLELIIDLLNRHYSVALASRLHADHRKLIESFITIINNRTAA
ncbi:MAG: glycosyltransferase [Methylocystaceae bacterium]|nr:glycosyltransferase [Methylocystaceae bacterium]